LKRERERGSGELFHRGPFLGQAPLDELPLALRVVADQTISLGEKRAILASWASDAAAVASNPALRELPGPRRLVTIDDVLEAMSALDHHPKGPPGGKPARMKSAARVGVAA
jgi:hypothetical protein